ncbi:MAG: penicillin-binding protein 2 [Burkholderiales bacterium]|nr:penicillin-binding protein 2 [Burkholderiales bacterium]
MPGAGATELKNAEEEIRAFHLRLVAAGLLVLACFALLAVRFFYLQVANYDEYQAAAEENRISILPIPPSRGLITDRNGVVLARNFSAYTLEITPSKVADLDATIEELAKIVEVQPRDRRRFQKLLAESRTFDSLPIRTRLTDEEVARFAAHRWRFRGVDIKARLFRQYPLGEVAAHVVGYIGRISQKDQEMLEERELAANYKGSEHIGKIGIEQSYERELHGITGSEQVEVDAGGRAVRTLSRTPPVAGNNLVLTIDIELQRIAEEALGDRKGAVVAIDPMTGELLAFASRPAFDPNLFVDGIDTANWDALNGSPDKPLLNRPLRGAYPPGSTYKPFMALAALNAGKRRPEQTISDPGYFMFGNHRFRDDKVGGHGVVDMVKSIVVSCDTYYYLLANDMGVDTIARQMAPFGFGSLTGIDIEGETAGVLPSTWWKAKRFRRPEQQKWYAGETISIGIGQGYNAYTPLQLAHATAIIAADGLVKTPRLVRHVHDVRTDARRAVELPITRDALGQPRPERLPFKPEHLAVIKRGLEGVPIAGTSARAFAGAGYVSAGKTGTAQVFSLKQNEKYDAKRVAAHLRDHAWYMAYAPADKPRIAVAVLVENGGFGAQSAAPIARMVFDYHLTGKRPDKPGQAPFIGKPDAASEDEDD